MRKRERMIHHDFKPYTVHTVIPKYHKISNTQTHKVIHLQYIPLYNIACCHGMADNTPVVYKMHGIPTMWTCRMKRDWRERERGGGKRDIRGKDRQTVREEKRETDRVT